MGAFLLAAMVVAFRGVVLVLVVVLVVAFTIFVLRRGVLTLLIGDCKGVGGCEMGGDARGTGIEIDLDCCCCRFLGVPDNDDDLVELVVVVVNLGGGGDRCRRGGEAKACGDSRRC